MPLVSSVLLFLTGASLALGLIYFRFWLGDRARRDYLAFSCICLPVSALSVFEFLMMHAQTVEDYNRLILFAYIAASPAIIAVTCFAYLHLGGRRWFFWGVIGWRLTVVVVNLIASQKGSFRSIQSLGKVSFLGETLTYPIAQPNVWMLISQTSTLLVALFCFDAAIRVWRQGNHRKAIVFGAGIICFVVSLVLFSAGVLSGFLTLPIFASLSAFCIIATAVSELNHDLQNSAKLSTKLIEHETELLEYVHRLDLSASAASVGLWTRTFADDDIWMSEKFRELFGFLPEETITPDKLVERVHPEDREVMLAARKGARENSIEYSIEYRIVLPDGEIRWLSSRGKPDTTEGRPNVIRGAVVDITRQKQAEESVHELYGKLIRAQEGEGARIARELHDDIGQRLSLLSIKLTDLRDRQWSLDLLDSKIAELIASTSSIASDTRRISRELHPSQATRPGLESAVRNFCGELTELHPIEINVEARDLPQYLPPDISLGLYRVAQESLRNAVTHSEATTINVRMVRVDSELHMTIADNGRGFEADLATSKDSLGLISIQERIRELHGMTKVRSKVGGGTVVDVRVPIPIDKAIHTSNGAGAGKSRLTQ
jgi:PAS domain S-box-containing protein